MQGVGAVIARSSQASADVVILGLEDDDSARCTLEACRSFGAQAELIVQDLAQSPEHYVDDLFSRVNTLMPGIDLLVNNAGTYIDPPFLKLTHDTFQKTMYLNVHAGFFITQAFARNWIKAGTQGRVLFTGSINGFPCGTRPHCIRHEQRSSRSDGKIVVRYFLPPHKDKGEFHGRWTCSDTSDRRSQSGNPSWIIG